MRTEHGLLRDRDRIPFAPAADSAIRRLLEFLDSGRIEVRRYTKRFLHGKAYVFRGHGAIIVAEWAKAADPASVQPAIRPVWRQAAEHLRRFLPPEMTQREQREIIEALEAPRSLRDERALRKVFRPDERDGEQTSRELARFVKERGFQPWRPPEPLPPIESDDVVLVVWMGIVAEQ